MIAAASPLNKGQFRDRVRGGETVVGTFVGLGAATAEIAAAAGVDFIILDTEHGMLSDDVVGPSVLAAGAYGVPVIARVESGERIRAGRALDNGAAGIMFPRVGDAAHAEQLLRALHFPPRGSRGVASYNRAARFSMEPENLSTASDEILGVVQIETTTALDAVEEIARLDGVDALFVGPLDLSYALGIPHNFSHPDFEAALRRIIGVAERAGKSAGILSSNRDLALHHVEMGFRLVAVGSDSTLFADALHSIVRVLKPIH